MATSTVLIISDATARRQTLGEKLRGIGCRVVIASGAESSESDHAVEQPDVVLVEDGINGRDPLDICRRVRDKFPATRLPYILLIPPLSVESQSDGDSVDENTPLADCVHALLGGPQAQAPTVDDLIVCDTLRIDPHRHRATLDGVELSLTLTEFRLLTVLAAQPGIVFTRAELCGACGRDHHTIQERTVDVHIKSLRQKLDEHAYLIETVRGVGYRFHEPSRNADTQATPVG